MSESTNSEPVIAVVLNRDLLFGSRIRNVLAQLGLEGRFVSTAEGFMSALGGQAESVAIGIIDMNGAVSWEVIRAGLSQANGCDVPTLAFGPHVDIDGRRAAKSAGVTRIVSNGQFHTDMLNLIDRYSRKSVER
jgi:hypothetical protein